MRQLYIICTLWTVVICAEGLSLSPCVTITPQSPAVELNTNLTAFCILDQECLRKLGNPIASSELFWQVGNTPIPKSQYTVINDNISSVTFEPTLSMHNSLTCSFKAYGYSDITLHGVYFTLGYPPEKPENLTCISNNAKTLICTWDPGRATIMPTTYTVHQYWREEVRKSCVAKVGNNFCTLNYPDFIPHINTDFMVKAVNELGGVESERVQYDIINIVKPDPPDIVGVLTVLQRALKVEWKNPMDENFSYNLRYRPKDRAEWSEVPADDLQKTLTSFTLQELESYQEYIISMRCKLMTSGLWSEWSKEYTAKTLDSAPSRAPEFWRKIRKTDSKETRLIQLMWKDLGSHANGEILGYNITMKEGSEVVESITVTDTTYDIAVSKDSYEFVLVAYNRLGSSPPATLIIPSATDNKVEQQANMNVKASSADGQLWVEWTQSGRALGYVIEWCANSRDCDPEWQREASNTKKTYLRGNIQPFVYYQITVNLLQSDGLERSSTVETYLEQGVPEVGPKVNTKSYGKTWATLEWDSIPLPKRRGFITNYTIEYWNNSSQRKVITVRENVTEYKLEPLVGNTGYSVVMTANAEKGRMSGPLLQFTTRTFETGEIEMIVVPSCIGVVLGILLLCCFFCNKREQIKKHIWPNVPDPSKSNIAQWTPQTPSRHESKEPQFQDGPFTDVSVVEITADKEKSDNDSEPKSVDPIKNTSEGRSSGIGGSSCLSSPQLSGSDSDGISSAQNTSSTVQYSTVIMGGYQGQTPMFSRSESTQPLLISEERPDEQQTLSEEEAETPTPSQYFKQNFTPEDGSRIQDLPPAPPMQDPAAQILHLAGFSHGHDNLDFTAGHDISPDSLSQEEVPDDGGKTYLPQTVRRGGYLPQ